MRKTVHLSLFLSFLFCVMFFARNATAASSSSVAAPEGRQIEIQGLNKTQVAQVRRDFPMLERGNIKLSDLDEVMRSLYQTGQFEDVQITEDDERHYVLRAYPILRVHATFVTGNTLVTNQEVIEALGLVNQEPLNRPRVAEGVDQLKIRYNEAGFLGVQISVELKNQDDGYDVTVKIDEGQSSTISAFEFNTQNEELEKDLLRIAKPFLKKRFQQSQLNKFQENVNEMFVDRRYLTTTISIPELQYSTDKSTVKIIYKVESPFRFILFFQGNVALSNSDLYSELQLTAHMGSSVNIASDLAQKIDMAYRRRGYANENVQPDDVALGEPFVHRLTFQIAEGAKVRIKTFQFSGTYSRPEKYYLDLMKSGAPSIIRSGFYSKEDLDKAAQSLQLELQKQGYLRAKVQNSRADLDLKYPTANVTVQLEEGPLTIVKAIEFQGATVPVAELMSQLTVAKDEPLSLTKLDASIESLKTYYANQGYLDMVLENEKEGLVQYAHRGTEATLIFQIKEGPLVRVGSIAIDGLTRTKEEIVRTELEFKLGDTLTPKSIQDTEYRLQRTGLFANIDVYTLEAGTPLSDRTVVVHVTEVDPGVFSTGAGISTEFGLTAHGFAGIAYNNLGGTARAISLRAEVKKVTDLAFFDYRVTAGYLEPYLFNTRTKGRITLTNENSIIARFSTTIPAIDSTKLENVLEREFNRHYKLTYNVYGIQYITNLDVSTTPPLQINQEIIGYIGPTFEMEYRDNVFNPRSGTYTRLNVEYADPAFGSSNSINYIRIVSSFNFYVPFFDKRLVWASSIRGGLVQNISTVPGSYIPISRKFFLGGQSTVRGYDPDSIPYGDSSDPATSKYSLQPIIVHEDSTFYLLKTELHFPLTGDLEGEVFYDQGSVRVSGYMFDPIERESVGVGVRYLTPVGPANLEYGYKLNHQSYDGSGFGRFDISIGTF